MPHIEITSSTRRAVRRSVDLRCDVVSFGSHLHREVMLDLSTRGACITSSSPLCLDEEVLVEFAPPGSGLKIEAIGRVAHVVRARRDESEVDTTSFDVAGIEFTAMTSPLQRSIERALRGLPPPVPPVRRSLELAWLDVHVEWMEELDDRVNVFTTSERITVVDDGVDLIETVIPGGAMRLPLHLRAC